MVVFKCSNGHYSFVPPEPGDDECYCGEGMTFTEVTDLAELRAQADMPDQGQENRHRFADAVMYGRLKELDPELAAWYIAHQRRGFWYA